MTKMELLAASALTLIVATPALAQTGGTTSSQNTAPTNGPRQQAPSPQTQGAARPATPRRASMSTTCRW